MGFHRFWLQGIGKSKSYWYSLKWFHIVRFSELVLHVPIMTTAPIPFFTFRNTQEKKTYKLFNDYWGEVKNHVDNSWQNGQNVLFSGRSSFIFTFFCLLLFAIIYIYQPNWLRICSHVEVKNKNFFFKNNEGGRMMKGEKNMREDIEWREIN